MYSPLRARVFAVTVTLSIEKAISAKAFAAESPSASPSAVVIPRPGRYAVELEAAAAGLPLAVCADVAAALPPETPESASLKSASEPV